MDTVHTVKNCFRSAAGVSAPKYAKRKTPATVCLSNSIFTKQLENTTVQKYTPRLETIIKTSRTYGVGGKNGTLTRETEMKEKKKTLLCLENCLDCEQNISGEHRIVLILFTVCLSFYQLPTQVSFSLARKVHMGAYRSRRIS